MASTNSIVRNATAWCDAQNATALNFSPYAKGAWIHDDKGRNYTVVEEEHWGKDGKAVRLVTIRDEATKQTKEVPTPELFYRFHMGEAESCRKCGNAALNFSPGDKVSIVDTDIRYGGDKGEVVRKDGFRYVVRLTSRLDKPEVLLQPNQLKAANAEDAQGHEHGSDGKFASKGGGSDGGDSYEDPKTKRMKERLAKMREKNEALRKEIDQRKAALVSKKAGLEKMRAEVMKANVDKWKAGLPKTKNTIVEKAINAVAKNGNISSELRRHIPSKLLPHILDAYKDEDGYWIEFDDKVDTKYDPFQQSSTIHEDTISEIKSALRKCVIMNAVAKNAAWSAERVEPGNEKELLSFHAEAFAKNPTRDRFERLARIVDGEASKGLLAKYYAPGNATSELMAAIREGREQVIGGKGSEVAKKIAGIVEGLRRIGTNSTNPVVANAMRETLNWSSFGGSDGQVVTMPIPKSEYGKSDLDFLVEWARKNSADLAKYYTPSNVASKVIALAEKAKRKIDDTTKRRQSEADARFGTGIGRVNVPDVPLKKTEPEIAEIRSVLAGIKQIPSASKEAQKRDAAMERRQKEETQRYYDTHQGARD